MAEAVGLRHFAGATGPDVQAKSGVWRLEAFAVWCIWTPPLMSGRQLMRRRRDEALKWLATLTPIVIAVISLLDHMINHAR